MKQSPLATYSLSLAAAALGSVCADKPSAVGHGFENDNPLPTLFLLASQTNPTQCMFIDVDGAFDALMGDCDPSDQQFLFHNPWEEENMIKSDINGGMCLGMDITTRSARFSPCNTNTYDNQRWDWFYDRIASNETESYFVLYNFDERSGDLGCLAEVTSDPRTGRAYHGAWVDEMCSDSWRWEYVSGERLEGQ